MSIADLKPAPYNPRSISPEALTGLEKSIERFGLVQPIVLNKRTDHVVGGHQRIAAMMKAGRTEAQVVIVDLPEAEEMALNITLNNPQVAGEFTDDLQALLDQLHSALPEYVDDLNLNDLWNGSAYAQGKTDPDEIPLPPKDPITKLGDLWVLGDHRLLCGDSTKIDDVKKLTDGELADMVFTDPPYNVDYDPEARESYFSPERLKNKLGKIKNDHKSPEDFRAFLDSVYSCIDASIKPGHAIYICHADTEGHHFRNAFIAQPWKLQSCLVWKKTVLVFGRADYHWMHEPILYGWKEGAPHVWTGDRTQTTIIEVSTDHYAKAASDTEGKYVHPTQKPVALISVALQNSSAANERVLDLFGGSGSTLIACEKLKRRSLTVELSPTFCDVIVKRWENFTGEKAVRV